MKRKPMLEAERTQTVPEETSLARSCESLDESEVHPVTSSLSGRTYQAPSYALAVMETVANPLLEPFSDTLMIVP